MRYEFPDKPALRSKILSDRVTYRKINFSEPILDTRVSSTFKLVAQEAGPVNGLRLSATTYFYAGKTFDFSFTYSFPIILPIEERHIEEGDILRASISYNLCEGFETFDYQIK